MIPLVLVGAAIGIAGVVFPFFLIAIFGDEMPETWDDAMLPLMACFIATGAAISVIAALVELAS